MTKSFAEEEEEFYALIGRTIVEFAYVEEALLRVFLASISGKHVGPVSSAFYAMQAFSSKLDMTDAALVFRLSQAPDLLAVWAPSDRGTGLKLKLTKSASQRNRLAHFHVTTWPQAKAGRRCAMEPGIFNARTWPDVTEEITSLYTSDIQSSRMEFITMRHKINGFAREVSIAPRPPEGSQQLRSDRYLKRILRGLTPEKP